MPAPQPRDASASSSRSTSSRGRIPRSKRFCRGPLSSRRGHRSEMAQPAAASNTDLTSIAQARELAVRAKRAWLELAEFSQEKIDAVVDAMAAAATPAAEAFARLAVEETGYGVVEDKIQKNLFSSQKVYEFIRPMKTVGVIARHEDRRV